MLPEIKTLEPSFNIFTNSSQSGGQHLLAELGWHGLSLVRTVVNSREITACKQYHFEHSSTPDGFTVQLAAVLEQEDLLKAAYQKTDLIMAFPESIITPHEVYNVLNNNELIAGVYGDLQEGVIKTDYMYRHNLHNVYKVPYPIHSVLGTHFGTASHWHLHSLLADAFVQKEDALHAVFYPGRMVVLLTAPGKLQWVQHLPFTTPETAAWLLLRVVQQAGLAADTLPLVLHGMIQEDSALWGELYKYFMHLSFAAMPEGLNYIPALQEQPPHFFSHLFACLLCVL